MELEPLVENQRLKIYLDVCCLNRPFDDWEQERIRLEGDTILSILERIRGGQWLLIDSLNRRGGSTDDATGLESKQKAAW